MAVEYSLPTESGAPPPYSQGPPTQGVAFAPINQLFAGEVLDTTVPVVGAFAPALGGVIAPSQIIQFDVTDDSGAFRRVVVHARFPDGLEEVVHNGDSFRGLYQGNSGRVLIAGGFRYTILRGGGWPQGGPIAINVFAVDLAGNEAA